MGFFWIYYTQTSSQKQRTAFKNGALSVCSTKTQTRNLEPTNAFSGRQWLYKMAIVVCYNSFYNVVIICACGNCGQSRFHFFIFDNIIVNRTTAIYAKFLFLLYFLLLLRK